MRKLTVWLAIVCGTAVAACQAAPERGSVAVIPCVNVSGEKWEQLRTRQTEKVNEWVRVTLPAAGFTLARDDTVGEAVGALKFDTTDESVWGLDALLEIGDRCKSAYVLFCAVVFTEQKEQNRIWYKDKEGRTDVRVWLVDVEARRAVINGTTFVGRSGGNRISIDNKGSERQVQAAANAVRDATRKFLAPYKAK